MLIKVKVYPKSKKEEVIKKSEDSFEAKVKEKPKQGLATQRVVELLARHFGISEKNVRLKKGAKQRNKIFEIYDNS